MVELFFKNTHICSLKSQIRKLVNVINIPKVDQVHVERWQRVLLTESFGHRRAVFFSQVLRVKNDCA